MTTLSLTLASARIQNLDEWALIRELRDWRGYVAGEWNEGQVALARWMLGYDLKDGLGVDVMVSRMLTCLSDTQAIRMLTGEAEPSSDVGAQIEALTERAVMLRMWRKPTAPPNCDPVARLRAASARIVTPAAAVKASAAAQPEPPRHVQLDDNFDLLNGTDGVTIVGHGQSIKIPLGAAAKLRGGLGQMLSM